MSQNSHYRRCVSFCTAYSYDLPAIANSLKNNHYELSLSRHMLHVRDEAKNQDIFLFDHGSFVCWGLYNKQELQWLDKIRPYSNSLLPKTERDHFCFKISNEKTSIFAHKRYKIDLINLRDDDYEIKLAISYGLAQSIKLETFEAAVQYTIEVTANIPSNIARYGAIYLSRRSILKRIGEIFEVRSLINLSSEYLDTPEFFWQNTNLEPYYIMTKQFLDIPSRLGALNHKLDVLQELLDILNNQALHSYSSRLEITIIILILIEIAISLFHWSIY